LRKRQGTLIALPSQPGCSVFSFIAFPDREKAKLNINNSKKGVELLTAFLKMGSCSRQRIMTCLFSGMTALPKTAFQQFNEGFVLLSSSWKA
jgi:hypothetical protein